MDTRIKTAVAGLTLRFATEDDVGLILCLTRELAEYARLSHEVVADEMTLRASLFGGRKVAEVVIAEYEGNPVGQAIFFHNFSTFLARQGIYIEDLYVKPQMRGKGIGQTMLVFRAKLAKERGCGRLEWSVLDWNEGANNFYNCLGAQPMNGWTVFRLTGNSLAALAEKF